MKQSFNYDLQTSNTLHLQAIADTYIELESASDITKLYKAKFPSVFILGEGSNTVFRSSSITCVVKYLPQSINILKQNGDYIWAEVEAGKNWHQFVTWAVEQKYGGIENLALIPGTVGAAPVQNIAAYGQNISDVCTKVYATNLYTNVARTFTKEQCLFSYRSSRFKADKHNPYLITKVQFKLSKKPKLSTGYYSIGGRYDSITQELANHDPTEVDIMDVYQAVINIRRRKLPDTKTIPSVGSFFKNPIVSRTKFQELSQQIKDLQWYPAKDLHYTDSSMSQEELVKIPIGRILDVSGWKGRQIGNCYVYPQWASILTHNGHATGEEFVQFTQAIIEDIYNRYGIHIEPEAIII